MRDLVTLDLHVNGEPHEIRCASHTTLLEVLRRDLHLTGTKRGCNQGVCGACSVLVDGAVTRSCLTLVANLGERHVLTIEGLAAEGSLAPIEQALLETGAVQCGFCTPGIVVAIEGALRIDGKPGEEALREALSGNLCRCSGYVKIMQAATRAVELRQ